MKYNNLFLIPVVFLSVLLVGACSAGSGSGSSQKVNFDKDASYSLGYRLARSWLDSGIIPDTNELLKGIKDVYGEKTPRIATEDMDMLIDEAYSAAQEQIAEETKQKENDFLAQNSKKDGVTVTESGLQYEIITEGRGAKPGSGDRVRMHYEATTISGSKVASTYDFGEPEERPMVDIPFTGWSEALQLMNEGSTYCFYIPADLGYGSLLVFKLELISILGE